MADEEKCQWSSMMVTECRDEVVPGNSFCEMHLEAYNYEKEVQASKIVPPDPHYPNWRYLCLDCMTFHEKDYRMPDFRMQCDPCQIIQMAKEIEEGIMTPDLGPNDLAPLSYRWRNDI